MSESQPFSIGVWPNGKPEQEHIDKDWLTEKGFTSTDENLFSKEIHPGKSIVFNLATGELSVKNGDNEPVMIAEHSPGIQYLVGIWKILTSENL